MDKHKLKYAETTSDSITGIQLEPRLLRMQ